MNYHALFLDEATERLAAVSSALGGESSADAWETIRLQAHTLRGMAAAMGFDAVEEHAAALEAEADPRPSDRGAATERFRLLAEAVEAIRGPRR